MRITTCLLILMISCAGWAAYAGMSAPGLQQESHESSARAADVPQQNTSGAGSPAGSKKNVDDSRPSHELPGGHVSDAKGLRSRAGAVKANRSRLIPYTRQHFTSGNNLNLHQAGSAKPSAGPRGLSIHNEKFRISPAIRPPSVFQPVVPTRSTVRFRSASPVAIGGSANPSGQATGAINGTRINRRP